MKLTFKIGDTFSVPIRFENDGVPIEITSDMTFSADIVNTKCEVVDSAIITPYNDQVTFKGYLLIEVYDTSNWKQGLLTLDIKYENQGVIKHSQDLQFRTIRSITE